MIVVIAEKPSVAKDLAKVLGASNSKGGYLEGNGYQVTWAFGHLVNLADPAVYGWEKWNSHDLPMIPTNFILKLNEDSGATKQFNIIKQLFSTAESIVVATDAGREGELIFRYIYEHAGCKKPFKRLWISSLTDEAIRKGLSNLKNGQEFDNLYAAAKSRSEADWLVGMNATRAFTLSSGSTSVISLGRVQTPTLAMICTRYLEHKNFKPTPYVNIKIKLNKDNITFSALGVDSYPTETEALSKIKSLSKDVSCTHSEVKQKTENPPTLFDLSALQQEANKRFGFSSQKTLDLAQELYENDKLLTYPRTGSSYLSDDMYDGLTSLVTNAGKIEEFKKTAQELLKEPLSKRVINNDKITDHHAIIPTNKIYEGGLSNDHDLLYKLVVGRLLAALSKPCIKEGTLYTFVSNNVFFKASGTIILSKGWRSVQNDVQEEESEEQQTLPKIIEKDILPILETTTDKKMTQPKKLLTEAALLKMMETAGKDIDDKELREALKEIGLGTPATRASIIETLFSRQYIERDKKLIIPTEKGLKVFEIIKDMPIANPVLTGEWERDLNHIASGNMIYSTFISAIGKLTSSVVQDFLSKPLVGFSLDWPICPKCKSVKLKDGSKTVSCPQESCKFVLWKNVNGKSLGENDLRLLIGGKETALIKGFSSKEGKKYDGHLFLKEDFSIGFKFPEARMLKMPCPKCKGTLEMRDKLIKCKGECDFVLFREVASKKLPEKIIAQLLHGDVSEKVEGFKSKEGKSFSAKLKLTDFKVGFVFEQKTR